MHPCVCFCMSALCLFACFSARVAVESITRSIIVQSAGGGPPAVAGVWRGGAADNVPEHGALPGAERYGCARHIVWKDTAMAPSHCCCSSGVLMTRVAAVLPPSHQGTILTREGVAGLYKGLVPNLIKVGVPAVHPHAYPLSGKSRYWLGARRH